jgi:hypothetical protein
MHESVSQYSPPQLVRYRTIALVCASLALCIGGAGLLGWILDVEFLKRIHPALVAMKANTSVCLILTSTSVFLLGEPSPSSWQRRLAQTFAVFVALIGLLTLI